MKRLLTGLSGLLSLLLLAAAGLMLAVTTTEIAVDASPYRSQLAAVIRGWSGLDVDIGGGARLWTGPRAGVALEQLRVSRGAAAAETGPLLTADRFSLRVDTLALLGGRLRPTSILLEEGEVRLREPPAAGAGWRPPLRIADLARWLTDGLRLDIRKSRLVVEDPGGGVATRLEMARAAIGRDGDALGIDLSGALNGEPFLIEGSTTLPAQGDPADGPIPLRLKAELLGLRVEASGSLPSPDAGVAGTLVLNASGGSLSGLGPWVGSGLASQGPVDVRATIQARPGQARVENLEATLDSRRLQMTGGDVRFPTAEGFALRDARVAYTGGRGKGPVKADIGLLRLSPGADALEFEFDGSAAGQAVRLQGHTAPPSALASMEGAVPLRLQGSLLGLEVGLDGTLGTRDDAMTLDASLTAKGPSLAGLARWIGPWSDRSGPVAARLRVKGGGISYRLSAVELSLGQRRLEGGVRLELTTPRPRVEVALELDQLDARGWLTGVPMAGRGGAQSGRPASLDGSLDLGWMDAADISARLRIRQLTTPLVAGATATVDIELGGRVLRLSADDIGVGDAPVTARFRLDGKTRPPQAQLRFDGRRLALAPMLAGTAAEGMIQGDVDLVLDLEAKGASIAGMLEALSGELLLLAQDGRADLSALDRMTPGVQDLWGLLATPQSRLARINCALGVLQFERGRADIAALIDSANSTVVGHGSLDLDVGTIDLRLDPSPKGVHLRVAAPVVIDGELAHPDIRVRKGELLVSLTGLASKIAVPHLLLVEAFGAAVSGNPCVALASGVPDSGPPPVKILTRPAKAAVGIAGDAAKGAAGVVRDSGGAVLRGAGKLLKGVGGAVRGVTGGERAPEEDR